MSDTLDPALVQRLIEAANQHRTEEFSGPLPDAVNALMDASANNGADVIKRVCEELPKIHSPHAAGMLAVWLGAMVENGHDPAMSYQAVRDAYLRWSVTIQTSDGDKAEGPDGAFYALENCGRSLVSHCMKDGPILDLLRANEGLMRELKRLESESMGAMWLMQLATQMSAELIVLNVEKQAGALVKYENLSNCFHLFTLLQGVLEEWLPAEKRPTKALMECARGSSSTVEHDEARWHFAQPDIPETQRESWVWGEAHPSSIRKIDGTQVLLLRPMILAGRSWDSGFFSPILHRRPPDVKLVHWLPQEEFLKWKERLQLPDRPSTQGASQEKKAWWKFW
jgi:hypothetical protein